MRSCATTVTTLTSMIAVSPGMNKSSRNGSPDAVRSHFVRAGGSGEERACRCENSTAEAQQKQQFRRRHAGGASGHADDIGADALSHRIRDHVIADGAFHRARTGPAPGTQHLLADDKQKMRGADDGRGRENSRQVRKQHKPRTPDDQQAAAEPGRDGVIAAIDKAADRNAEPDRQYGIDRGDDADPDDGQIELDGAIRRGDAHDSDDRLLDEGSGNDGKQQTIVHSR